MAPTSLLSTIANLFLPPCLRPEPHSPPHQKTKTRQVVCNQYGRRLYLRPIMPPTTRRQSRMVGDAEGVVTAPVVESARSRSRSRKSSISKRDNTQVKQETPEQKQSLATFSTLPKQEEDEDVKENNMDIDAPPILKERTFSMEMHRAIEALHRDEDVVEQEHDTNDVLEIIDAKDDEDADVSDQGTDTSSPPTPTPTYQDQPSSFSQIAITGVSPESRPDLYFRTSAAPVVAPNPLCEPPSNPWVMYYDCAVGCLKPIKITQGEPLRCKECGAWMVYKKRTKRMCVFEAR